MESVLRAASENWWQYLVRGVLAVIFGIIALVWPSITLAILIVVFGLFVLLSSIVTGVGAIARAGTGQLWGWQLTAGVLGIVAGLIILRWPGVTAVVLLFLIALWLISTGLIEIVAAVADHQEVPHAWLLAIGGIVSVLFGVAMFVWPNIGLLTVVYLVGIYAIVDGIVLCVVAFRVRSLHQQLVRRMPPAAQAPGDGAVPSY